MSYTKTTWNNLTNPPISAANLNKIEMQLEANSTAIDNLNALVKPTEDATTQAEITEGQITNVIGIKELILKGQTSQDTTTGKNLLKPIGTSSSTSYGITRTTNSDGSVTLSGTASADTYLRISDFLTLESNTAYTTLNQNANLPTGVTIYYNDVSNIGVTYNDTVIPPNGRVKAYTTGTVSGTTSIALLIQSGTSFSTPLTLYPMLVKGTVTTSNIPTYEPYTGGKAIPNPDNPQDVNVVKGSNVISICNKNLFNNIATSQTKHGIVFTINADKSIYANGTATSSNALALNQVYLEKGKTYFLSGCPSGGGSGKYTLSINTTGTTTRLATDEGSGVSYTPTESGTYDISIGYWYGFNLNNLLFKPQIEIGSTATSYVAHQEKNYTITFPSSIELCKIGDYQDYIFRKDNKWYKYNAIGKIVLDGTETWTTVSTNQSGKYRPQINLSSIVSANLVKPSSNAEVGLILSDHYRAVVAGSAGTFGANEGISLDTGGYVQVYDDNYNTNDISLFKTWLATHNITLYYVLATPVIDDLSFTSLNTNLTQLYNTGLYEVSNISQDAADLPIILSIDACKDNLKGVVEYIRR